MLVNGNALHLPLADDSVHCVVTSPSYYGLRDYGTATWQGGDAACDHTRHYRTADSPGRAKSTLDGGRGTNAENERSQAMYRDLCPKCGAVRVDQQIGLEPVHDCLAWARGEPPCGKCYVCQMRAVFQEVKRVMRPDAVLFLNLGDSYASASACQRRNIIGNGSPDESVDRPNRLVSGLKEKDLMMIPARVALALQHDGAVDPLASRTVSRLIAAITDSYESRDQWPDRIAQEVERLEREYEDAHHGAFYLRSDIIWAKPNPMPESVTDRPTKAHEYVFLLSKSAKYFYDADAIREDAVAGWRGSSFTSDQDQQTKRGLGQGERVESAGRNRRTVWTVATAPYGGAHFATYPPALITPMILAGTSQRGVCPQCGAPWERVTEHEYVGDNTGKRPDNPRGGIRGSGLCRPPQGAHSSSTTLGWRPTCAHDLPPVGGIVLDPFCGSGTTGQVARELGRRFVGVDLSLKYLEELALPRAEGKNTDAALLSLPLFSMAAS